MDSRTIKPLADNETSTGWLPSGGLRWIQLLAIAGLVVIAVAYVMNAGKSGAAGYPMRIAISEPGTTILPSAR
jgi:hypothetical protein